MTLEEIGIIVGISATVSAGTVYIIKQLRSILNKGRKKLNGQWTNKSFLAMVMGRQVINMSLQVDCEEGKISGKATIFDDDTKETHIVNLGGNVYYKTAIVNLVLLAPNQVAMLGKVKLKRRDNLLEWKAFRLTPSDKYLKNIVPSTVRFNRPIEEYHNKEVVFL